VEISERIKGRGGRGERNVVFVVILKMTVNNIYFLEWRKTCKKPLKINSKFYEPLTGKI
jgi:hypothetical protein